MKKLWLRDMIRKIPKEDMQHAVAHRGFHNPKGRSDLRPLENPLAAFEAAWTNGVYLCECDVALTKDEKLVLAHDTDFSRLSLDPLSDNSNTKVSDLTFNKELIALTLKNGVRAPLLLEVLQSTSAIGQEAKLIIELKPGNNQAAMALARLLGRLDGVYVRSESEMLEPDGAAKLKALCDKYTVGVWGEGSEDPDDYETMHDLVKECGVSYFKTDLPHTFLTGVHGNGAVNK